MADLILKPVAVVAGAAGMKKCEFAVNGVWAATAKGCFGWEMANLGSLSSVILCLLRLRNISAPLNVGCVCSLNFAREANFSDCCREDNENIFDVKLQKKGRYIVVLEIF